MIIIKQLLFEAFGWDVPVRIIQWSFVLLLCLFALVLFLVWIIFSGESKKAYKTSKQKKVLGDGFVMVDKPYNGRYKEGEFWESLGPEEKKILDDYMKDYLKANPKK